MTISRGITIDGMNSHKQKYFLLYLKTGAGHFAPASSIAHYLSAVHGDAIEPVLIDGLTDAKSFPRSIIENGYRLLQARAKWYYEFLYATNKFPPIGYLNVAIANFFIKPYLKKRIDAERPEKIVIFHFFLIAPVLDILRELQYQIPVITAVTDPFTAHPLWFQRAEQRYVVFSERLKKYCIELRKIPEAQLQVFPFIVDEKFSAFLPPAEIAAVKQKYGFALDKKCVLIIGGGDGIPNGKNILRQLLRASLDVEIAIVCGKNRQLHAVALELQLQYPSLKVFGFVDFVYELLNASDIVITKCGASTIMEILMMKKIPIINDYIWEQELGNMEFVRDNELGIFERDIAKLPSIVRKLVSDETEYHHFRQNIEMMKMRSGTREVAEFLVTMINQQ
jgi:processive 1,2-diacylglycerol beta-glucosyltransferase/1,2-diacylglycerol 3-beta-galactosyltransferase